MSSQRSLTAGASSDGFLTDTWSRSRRLANTSVNVTNILITKIISITYKNMMNIVIIVFVRSCALGTWVFKLTIRLNIHHHYKKVQFYHCMSRRLQSVLSGDIRRNPKTL